MGPPVPAVSSRPFGVGCDVGWGGVSLLLEPLFEGQQKWVPIGVIRGNSRLLQDQHPSKMQQRTDSREPPRDTSSRAGKRLQSSQSAARLVHLHLPGCVDGKKARLRDGCAGKACTHRQIYVSTKSTEKDTYDCLTRVQPPLMVEPNVCPLRKPIALRKITSAETKKRASWGCW